MELAFPVVEVEKSAPFKTTSFGFGNSGVIAHILRKKIYSNPIYVLCQEIMSNARDANREAGRANEPIKVKAPSSLDLHLAISDHGIGISPDRMANVFVLYGVSTKRGDNQQTGGFGIGAKTPFSYTDAFQVVTVTEEDGKRVKRTYSAYLDTSQMGAMSLLSQEDTKENTGTEIKVLVERKDIAAFCSAIARITEFWEPRPKVGSNVVYSTTKITVDKGDWFIYGEMQQQNSTSYGSYHHKEASFCLIDGIRYPLDTNNILAWIGTNRPKLQNRASAFLSSNIVLRFKTGQVAVAASREALDYIDATYNSIADAVDKATQELVKECEAAIVSATTLKEAVEAFNKFKFRGLVNDSKWRGIPLEDNYQLEHKFYYYGKNRGGGLRSDEGTNFNWSPVEKPSYNQKRDCTYYIDEIYDDDVKTTKPNPKYDATGQHTWGVYGQKELINFKPPNKKKVKTLSDLHGLSDRWSNYTFAIIRFENKAQLDAVLADNTNILNHIGVKYLKDVAETKIITVKGAGVKLGSFRTLQKVGYNYKWEESKTINQTTGGVYCVLKQGGTYIKVGSKEVDRSEAMRIQRLMPSGTEIVAVGQRLADKLAKDSNWTLLEKKLQGLFDEASTKLANISGYFMAGTLEAHSPELFTELTPFIEKLHNKSPLKKMLSGVVLASSDDFQTASKLFSTNLVAGVDPQNHLAGNVEPAEILLAKYPLLYVIIKTYTPSNLTNKVVLQDIKNYITEKEKLYV